MCFDGQLWSTLDATEYYDKIPVDQLAKIVTTAGPFVKYLNLRYAQSQVPLADPTLLTTPSLSRGCIQLTNDWRTPAIWNAPRNLLTATLEGCALSRASLQFLIIRNPTLLHLNLSGLPTVTNSIARLIAQSCPNLESLNVNWCTNMDARGIKKIVEACPNLRELRACELERFDEAPVMSALWRANAVQHLHLAACPGLGDDAIRTLVLGPDPELDPFTNRPRTPPRRLLHLNLGRCTRLTDAALRALADNVPMLEGLELGGCVALTDAGFAALIPTLPRLTHLDLEECTEVTDATLVALARGPAARRLTSVGVSYCENVGDAGVVELVRKCRVLGNLECDNSESHTRSVSPNPNLTALQHASPTSPSRKQPTPSVTARTSPAPRRTLHPSPRALPSASSSTTAPPSHGPGSAESSRAMSKPPPTPPRPHPHCARTCCSSNVSMVGSQPSTHTSRAFSAATRHHSRRRID